MSVSNNPDRFEEENAQVDEDVLTRKRLSLPSHLGSSLRLLLGLDTILQAERPLYFMLLSSRLLLRHQLPKFEEEPQVFSSM